MCPGLSVMVMISGRICEDEGKEISLGSQAPGKLLQNARFE